MLVAENIDPYPDYLKKRKDIFYIDKNNCYNFYKYDDVSSILKNPIFGREINERKNDTYYSFLDSDDPYHLKLRRIVAPFFSPLYIKKSENKIIDLVNKKITEFKKKSQVDLAVDYTLILPFEIISDLIGAPVINGENIKSISSGIVNALDFDYMNKKELLKSLQEHRKSTEYLASFMSDVLDYKKKNPQDDLSSFLVHSDELSAGETLTFCLLLYIAGFETTTNMIGNSIYYLLKNPESKKDVLQNGLTNNGIEELLRYDTSIHRVLRKVKEDFWFETKNCKIEFKKNQRVFAHVASANRDEEIFESPDRLDLDRHNANRNLSFSSGTHFCIGSFLAKQEMKILIESIFKAFPNMELTDQFEWKSSRTFRGPNKMVIKTNNSIVREQ